MELRLYKQLYREARDPSRVRLLFEGKAPAGPGSDLRGDFYLFVWLRDKRYVESFQAVLNDDLVFSYGGPGNISIGRITDNPVKRSIQSGGVSENENRRIRQALSAMRNRDFPDLMTKITGVAGGGAGRDLQLSDAEQRFCRQLESGGW